MNVLAQAFWLPKAGNTNEEYEDAYWPEQEIDHSTNTFSCAVADGATETSFSGLWAKMLVRAYCEGELNARKLPESLSTLQSSWLSQVSSNPLPWYAEEKLQSGAFSSLVGLTISKTTSEEEIDNKWEAIGIGDSCLFQMRDGELIYTFPLDQSDQFNSRPSLISSNPANNSGLFATIFHRTGVWELGDTFYLMTDALACWFLLSTEQNERPSEILRDIIVSTQFADWIVELREDNLIRNDDVTLLRVEIA